jgi:DNA-binding FadR family transcriptional regulator
MNASTPRHEPTKVIRTNKTSSLIAADIVEEIVRQGLKPGDKLPPEANMLADYAVGRASIREGLRVLEALGVLSIRAGKTGGPVVGNLDHSDLARNLSVFFRLLGATYGDLIEARHIIDPMIARLAAQREDVEAHNYLREVLKREAEPEDEEEPRRSVGFDFHYAVSAAAGNPILTLLSRSLRALYAEHLQARGLLAPEEAVTIPGLHAEIGNAILAGDAPLAEKLMRALVEKFAEVQYERNSWFIQERIAWTT